MNSTDLDLVGLKAKSILRKFEANEVVFAQGDHGECAYIIESGRVQITIQKDGEEFPVSLLGEGDIFGEMAILEGLPRAATAIALDEAHLCVISQEQLFQRIQSSDPIVRLLVQILMQRTREMNSSFATNKRHDSNSLSLVPSGGLTAELHLKSQESRDAINQVKFEAELYKAFDEKEFRMHYQPIVDLHNYETQGFEALIRWNSPTMGRMRPDLFMKVAEDCALMIPLGRWIQQQALEDLKRIEDQLGREYFMSINVSGRQFLDPDYLEDLEATRRRIGISAKRIKLEVTEKILLDGSVAIKTIEACRQLGFEISLDDFGTGYSSLSYLKELIVDNLKVDQSFIRSVTNDSRASSLVSCIINMSKALGIKSVAEGIEELPIAESLKQMGCEYGQGYYFAKPEDVETNVARLQKLLALKKSA